MFKKTLGLPLILCLFIGLTPALCQAEFQDPTKPDSPKFTVNNSDHTAPQEKWVLSAIWITASGKWATINGITAKPGQTILNKVKVIKINKNTVFLSDNGDIKKLYLLRPLSKIQ